MKQTPKQKENETTNRQVVDVDGTKLIFENEKPVDMEMRADYQANGQMPMEHALKITEFLMQRRMALKDIDESIEGLQHIMMPSEEDNGFEGEDAIFGTIENEEPFDPELFDQQSGEKDSE
jgi:hypothetical protein